ncbi:MAG: hypothetical protein J5I47_13540 [Vicingus serpentipes]|nr:hypothetical protein [Vicingus serpentipes]
MKIEIDFDNKVIKVVQKCNFKKLMDFVQTLPDWETFDICSNNTSDTYYYPVYIPWYWTSDSGEVIVTNNSKYSGIQVFNLDN